LIMNYQFRFRVLWSEYLSEGVYLHHEEEFKTPEQAFELLDRIDEHPHARVIDLDTGEVYYG